MPPALGLGSCNYYLILTMDVSHANVRVNELAHAQTGLPTGAIFLFMLIQDTLFAEVRGV